MYLHSMNLKQVNLENSILFPKPFKPPNMTTTSSLINFSVSSLAFFVFTSNPVLDFTKPVVSKFSSGLNVHSATHHLT